MGRVDRQCRLEAEGCDHRMSRVERMKSVEASTVVGRGESSEISTSRAGCDPARPISGKALRRSLMATTLAWIFGNVWYVTITGAPFTLFYRAMKASPFEVGLLSAIPYLAALISLPASVLIERTGARKPIFFF